jgi:hypothetical protein
MDELEKYLKNHQNNLQNSFDWNNEEALWAKIEAKLDEKESESNPKQSIMLGNSPKNPKGITITYKNLWRAAAVIAFFVLGYAALRYDFRGKGEEQASVEIKKINPELAEVEVYYTSLIDQKRKELKEINPAAYDEFEKDFAKLDSAYQQLRKDFKKSPNQEQVSNAMIQNLRLRIEILERQIEILEKINQPQNIQSNETIIL